jgi:rubrerythrin
VEHLQSTSEYLQKLDAMTKVAKAEGKTEVAERLQLEFNQKKEMQIKLMQAVTAHSRKLSQQQASGSANPSQPQGFDYRSCLSICFSSLRILSSYS